MNVEMFHLKLTKVVLFDLTNYPLQNYKQLNRDANITDWLLCRFVIGNSIGKLYARTNELGVPFAVTVDSETSFTSYC